MSEKWEEENEEERVRGGGRGGGGDYLGTAHIHGN